ncbi:MAG: MarR family transcriptional regulator [Streptococcaceae bacterium]|jgi:DNA-binding MarR family transcriptional regulator|nr:MarR family transcriptional regulator [Streptococcaceae bacterium]
MLGDNSLVEKTTNLVNQLSAQHELLLGHCTSKAQLTATQEHILMLLASAHPEGLTNSEIAATLDLTAAAVTKALKKLSTNTLVQSKRDTDDSRRVVFRLAQAGEPIAAEHSAHHKKTLSAFVSLVQEFDPSEQVIITRYLTRLMEVIQS